MHTWPRALGLRSLLGPSAGQGWWYAGAGRLWLAAGHPGLVPGSGGRSCGACRAHSQGRSAPGSPDQQAGQSEMETYCRNFRAPGGSRLPLQPYHPEQAQSHLISEAKQGRAWLTLGRETAWEYQVLLSFCFPSPFAPGPSHVWHSKSHLPLTPSTPPCSKLWPAFRLASRPASQAIQPAIGPGRHRRPYFWVSEASLGRWQGL